MLYYANGVKLNNKIIEIKKFVKIIIYFNFLCIMKHIFTSEFFSKNASFLQKFKNKIPSSILPIKTILSVFEKKVSCLWKWKCTIQK